MVACGNTKLQQKYIVLGKTWMRIAQDRKGWRAKEQAYTQQWVFIG